MTLIGSNPDIYQLDIDEFRKSLKALEESEDGICFPDTHKHTTEVTLSGSTYARFVEIINGYTVTFEQGDYGVSTIGANHNIMDVLNMNGVSLLTQNSQGLQTISGEINQFADDMTFVKDMVGGRQLLASDKLTAWKDDGSTQVAQFETLDKDGNPTSDPTKIVERRRI
jgi:hypothetical protein